MQIKINRLAWVIAMCAGLIAPQAMAGETHLSNRAKVFTKNIDMNGNEADDPAEMQRVWEAALVRAPTGKGESRRTTVKKLQAKYKSSGKKFPVVIYLHGCSGIWTGTYTRIKFYADNGYIVIAPASFAREKYPKSCDIATIKAGLYRRTLSMRQNDAGYAIEKAAALSFVDPDRIILAGLSQGGVTTATFKPKNAKQKTAARIIEGWTCHAGWNEYKGLGARPDEPVLSLVGIGDAWFQHDWARGDCGDYMKKGNGSKSVVYKTGAIANFHELMEFDDPKKQVLEFLDSNLN